MLFMVCEWFKVAEKDRDMVDTNKLQQLKITNGELQKFIFKWDAIVTQMRKVPDDQSLLTCFLLQVAKLPKTHDFYLKYCFWHAKPKDDRTRSNKALHELVHEWMTEQIAMKTRHGVLTEHQGEASAWVIRGAGICHT